MNLSDDLAARWTPSREQDEAAAAALKADEHVYTAHVLVSKEFGWWTPDVRVVHLPGVFTTREEAQEAADKGARAEHKRTQLPVTGGWTVHRRPLSPDELPRSADGTEWLTHWAVFEDILAVYPERN